MTASTRCSPWPRTADDDDLVAALTGLAQAVDAAANTGQDLPRPPGML
ncbi:hypothetical protein ACH4GK_38255 [Streptomyces rimosus]|nr:hypothetical protein [Streptomyces rimosus]